MTKNVVLERPRRRDGTVARDPWVRTRADKQSVGAGSAAYTQIQTQGEFDAERPESASVRRNRNKEGDEKVKEG